MDISDIPKSKEEEGWNDARSGMMAYWRHEPAKAGPWSPVFAKSENEEGKIRTVIGEHLDKMSLLILMPRPIIEDSWWSWSQSSNSTIYAYLARSYIPGENPPWEIRTGRVTTQPSRTGSRRPASRASNRASGVRAIRRDRSRTSTQSDSEKLANASPTELPMPFPGVQNAASSAGQQREELVRDEQPEMTPICLGTRQYPYPAHGSSTPRDGYVDPQLLQHPSGTPTFPELYSAGVQTPDPQNGMADGNFAFRCVVQASNEPFVSRDVGFKDQGDDDKMFEECIDCSRVDGEE